MISKSDLVIMTVATCALALGIFRWHQNTQNVSVVTIPASSTSDIVVATPMLEEPQATEVNTAAVSLQNETTIVAEEPIVAEYLEYTVKSGDSLSVIAQRHNTSVATLQRLNSINGTTIRIGQTLRYPNPAK